MKTNKMMSIQFCIFFVCYFCFSFSKKLSIIVPPDRVGCQPLSNFYPIATITTATHPTHGASSSKLSTKEKSSSSSKNAWTALLRDGGSCSLESKIRCMKSSGANRVIVGMDLPSSSDTSWSDTTTVTTTANNKNNNNIHSIPKNIVSDDNIATKESSIKMETRIVEGIPVHFVPFHIFRDLHLFRKSFHEILLSKYHSFQQQPFNDVNEFYRPLSKNKNQVQKEQKLQRETCHENENKIIIDEDGDDHKGNNHDDHEFEKQYVLELILGVILSPSIFVVFMCVLWIIKEKFHQRRKVAEPRHVRALASVIYHQEECDCFEPIDEEEEEEDQEGGDYFGFYDGSSGIEEEEDNDEEEDHDDAGQIRQGECTNEWMVDADEELQEDQSFEFIPHSSSSSTQKCCLNRHQVMRCVVCLEDFYEGLIVKQLPCGHIFHAECILRWLTQCKRTCPVKF